MATALTYTNGEQEAFETGATIYLPEPSWSPTAVYETGTTQNGTYNGEPAYEGVGYWIFYTGAYWCKNTTKTDNYWECDLVTPELGGFAASLSTNTIVPLPTTNGSANYFGSCIINQTANFPSLSVRKVIIGSHLVLLDTVEFGFNTIGSVDAVLAVYWNGDCKFVNPVSGNDKKTISTYGLIVGDDDNTFNASINYADMGVESGYRGWIENNCQTLNSIGQTNSVCQLMADEIMPASGTSVLADEVIYDEDYVRTSANSGTSFPVSPAEGDFFYRTDRRCLFVYDGEIWLVPTEGFPKYSSNNWDAVKEAWGHLISRWDSTLHNEPKVSELSGTWGQFDTSTNGVASGYRWRTGHTLLDGNVIFMPDDETFTLTINTETDTPAYTVNCSGNNQIYASAYYEGCIYAYSYAARKIVKIDPSDNSVVQCTSDVGGVMYGGTLYNGLIYFAPVSGNQIIAFDPTDNSVTTHNSTVNSFTSTVNITLAADNCLYMLPYRTSDFIVKFDPSDNTFTEITINLSINTADKRWDTFQNGSDGLMYLPPTITGCGSQPAHWYNPFTGGWGQCSGFTSATGDAFLAGTPHPSGRLVFAPGNDQDTYLVIDTDTKVATGYDKTAAMQAGQKVFQLAGNGVIYGVGRYTSNTIANNTVWKIELGSSFSLDTQFNSSIYLDA